MNYIRNFQSWIKKENFQTKEISYERAGGITRASSFFQSHNVERPIVVCVHGTGNDRFYPYIQLYKYFLKNGFDVFCFDLDGHGLESTNFLDIKNIFTSVPDAIRQCSKLFPRRDIFLFGHSLGGTLALAAADSGLVKAVCAVSAPLLLQVTNHRAFRELCGIFYPHSLKQAIIYGLFGSLPAAGNFKRKQFPIRISQITPVRGFYYVSLVTDIISNAAKDLKITETKIPHCLIYGSCDTISNSKDAEAIFDSSNIFHFERENHVSTIFAPKVERTILEFLCRHATLKD